MTEHTIAELRDALLDAVGVGDTPIVEELLSGLTTEQLRLLVADLAARARAHGGPAVEDAVEPGPRGICRAAVAMAAQAFGTTPELIQSPARMRTVSDARAVAMAAARRHGLTLTAIAAEVGKDYTSVIYAVQKVAQNPRLDDAATRIVSTLDARYTRPRPDVGAAHHAPAGTPPSRPARSNLLQSAALRASMSRPEAAELVSDADTVVPTPRSAAR